jgi:dTDP-N-acetylfucosamine:lipid II N-acetylfucosaminyltransferase
MILHFASDDKFTDYAISQFSNKEVTSEFIVVSYSGNDTQHIKQSEKIKIIKWQSDEYKYLLKQLSEYKAIILHGLFDPWMEEIIDCAPDNVKIAWVFWGGEIYGRSDLKNRYITIENRILYIFRNFWIKVKGKKEKNKFDIPKKSLNRIDYCLTDVSEDFEFIKSYLKNSRMKELWYNYYSIEETAGPLMNSYVNNENILIGNSCTIENNHLSAFRKIKKFSLENKKVIVPLSYGSPWLRRYLLKVGKTVLGDSFYPLTVFLEGDAYNKLMLSCSVVIMNHYRPQAMGNILTALWLGAKVYMSKKSKLYKYYKRLGLILFLIEDDFILQNPEALMPLPEKARSQNRQILIHEYGKQNMNTRIEIIIDELTKTTEK